MNNLDRFRDITTFVFDVDGVMTNNQILVLEDGSMLRTMNVRDGYAIHRAIKQGYKVAVITGGSSEGVIIRLKKLGITDVFSGIRDKREAFDDLVFANDLNRENVLYMGDDIIDLTVMQQVGLPCSPADGCPEAIQIARYVSPYNGGEGCVRDVIEKVLRLQGKWA